MVFIGYPKCTTCQRAKAFLDDIGVAYEFRDIKMDNPTYDELKTWLKISGLPVKKLFNTSGVQYKSLNLKKKLPMMNDDECLRLLASDGMLVKRPLLVDECHALVGFKKDDWLSLFTEYDRKGLDAVFQDYFKEMLQRLNDREKSND